MLLPASSSSRSSGPVEAFHDEARRALRPDARFRLLPLCVALALGVVAAPGHADASLTSSTSAAILDVRQPVLSLPVGIRQVGQAIYGVTEYRLANGMTVLLMPDTTQPVMAVDLVYKVGARHEGPGEAGLAHLLEHMMFKGTAAFPEPMKAFHQRNIEVNAATSHDSTSYHASFTADDERLFWMLDWLADGMQNMQFSAQQLRSERSVVVNELQIGENKASEMLFQQLMATAYQFHPYGRPVIGTVSDIDAATPDSLARFYKTWYRPDNAVLIVGGQIDAMKTLARIQQAFGGIAQPGTAVRAPQTLEPVQQGEREVIMRREGGTPMLRMAYHIPDAASREHLLLKILGLILTVEPEGVLYQKLVKPGHATSVNAYTVDTADPDMLVISVSFKDEKKRDLIKKTLAGTLEQGPKLRQNILDKIKQLAQHYRQRIGEDPQALVMSLGNQVEQGDWRLAFMQMDIIQQITLDDIRQAARRWLVRDNRTTAWYLPTSKPLRAPQASRSDVAALVGKHAWPSEQSFAPDAPMTAESIIAHTQRGRLPGGLRYALLPRRTKGDRVHLNLDLRWGSLQSLRGRGNDDDFLDELLMRATRKLSETQIRDRLIELDAELIVSGVSRGAGLYLEVPERNLEAALTLGAQLLREPVFRADLLEESRRAALAAQKHARNQPDTLIGEEFDRRAKQYPSADPRHIRTAEERARDYKAQTPERIARFWRDFAGASHGELVAVGAFDPEGLKQLVQKLFGDWKSPHAYERFPADFHHRGQGRVILHSPDKANAEYVQRRQFRMSREHQDFIPLKAAISMLGEGTESRLWQRVREQEGLSYGLSATFHANTRDEDAEIEIRASLAPANLERLEQAIQEEIRRVLKDGFTQEELDTTIRNRLESNRTYLTEESNVVSMLSGYLYWDIDMREWISDETRIRNLRLAEVNAAFRKWFSPDDALTVAAGSFAPGQLTRPTRP